MQLITTLSSTGFSMLNFRNVRAGGVVMISAVTEDTIPTVIRSGGAASAAIRLSVDGRPR